MFKARIYQPDKTAMQSGKAKQEWVVEFAPAKSYFVDGLMGWTGMTDMPQELVKRLTFPNREAAIAYAERQRFHYEVFEPTPRKHAPKAYAENFKSDKRV